MNKSLEKWLKYDILDFIGDLGGILTEAKRYVEMIFLL